MPRCCLWAGNTRLADKELHSVRWWLARYPSQMSNQQDIPLPAPDAGRTSGRLSPRQSKFAREYVRTLNGTASAKAAGYSAASAHERSHDLLRNPKVQDEIRRFIFEQAPLLQARVLDETANIALANAADFYDWSMEEPVVEILEDGSSLIRQQAVVRLKPSHELNRRQTAAIKRIVERTGADGSRRVEVEMHNKDASLDRLARLLGMLGSGETTINLNTAPVASVEISYADEPVEARTIDGEAREVNNDDG